MYECGSTTLSGSLGVYAVSVDTLAWPIGSLLPDLLTSAVRVGAFAVHRHLLY